MIYMYNDILFQVMRISSTDLSGQIRPVASDSEDSEGDEHKLNIAQAFADDDVVEEFSQKRKRKPTIRSAQ